MVWPVRTRSSRMGRKSPSVTCPRNWRSIWRVMKKLRLSSDAVVVLTLARYAPRSFRASCFDVGKVPAGSSPTITYAGLCGKRVVTMSESVPPEWIEHRRVGDGDTTEFLLLEGAHCGKRSVLNLAPAAVQFAAVPHPVDRKSTRLNS